jgi:LacI family transcriptional regulator
MVPGQWGKSGQPGQFVGSSGSFAAGARVQPRPSRYGFDRAGALRRVMASVKDVAARAGVSLGTVSNVLNRPHLVADSTRQRVLDAISELRFVRNEHARQLRAGSSRSLGFVVLDASNPFFTDVARGVEDAAQAAGLSVYLCNSNDDPLREASYLDLLLEQRVQGVLITPIGGWSDRLVGLVGRGMPVILVDRGAPGSELCSVAVDDVVGGELAAAHLVEAGHRRIGFVGGPFSLPQVSDRHAGALTAIGGGTLTVIETDHLTVAEGRRAAERLLGIPARKRPTAVFCGNDLLALGLLQQLTVQGVNVPRDIAIVGYDDIAFAEAAAVPLSSVRQPRHQLGVAAAELLLDEVEQGAGHQHRQVVFKPELIVRASSAAR